MQKYAFLIDNLVHKVEECSEDSYLEQSSKYSNIVDVTDTLPVPQIGWSLVGNVLTPPVALTNSEKDKAKYFKRARVRDQIVVEMTTENMARVRSGEWTVPELTSLTQDAELKLVLDDVNTLSYELAVQKIQTLTNPLMTSAIKAGWTFKLMSHFYN